MPPDDGANSSFRRNTNEGAAQAIGAAKARPAREKRQPHDGHIHVRGKGSTNSGGTQQHAIGKQGPL
jgi:hypothetical protein